MKLFKLITLLSLVGCGGPEFSGTAQKFNPEAGAAGQNESGEGGENSSAGLNSGGSASFAGSDSGGTKNGMAGTAGKDTGGSDSGGTAGTSNGGGGSSTGGNSVGGSAGNNSAGTGGSGFNPCALSDKTFACENVTWDWASHVGGEIDMHTPAKYAWECPITTDTPPNELMSNFSGGNVRQCVASKFGAPNTLWCCTSN